MNVKRYLAANSREALFMVKKELGEDAVILSNRQVLNGVEIMALANADVSSLVTEPKKKTAVPNMEEQFPPTYSPSRIEHAHVQVSQSEIQVSPSSGLDSRVPDRLVKDVIAEIKAMQHTLEDQIATVAWGNFTQRNPTKMRILHALLNAGFSPLLSRRLTDKLPENLDYEQSLKKSISALAFNMKTVDSDEMIEKGGVFALVGPTGVGKTTTTAKLAARGVIRHGADKIALLTTDSYRIGGHEQLRIYGKLLGIPVRTIKDTDDLQLTLSELTDKHLVLIDTIGMSQRDQMVAEQMDMLCNGGSDIKRMLLINATSNGNTLDEVISAYQDKGIHGCIITKVDEAASLGVALDAVVRKKLLLHYVANGQKVPEDLHSANPRYLLHRIFKTIPRNSPFTLQDVEFAMMMASSDHQKHDLNKNYVKVNYG